MPTFDPLVLGYERLLWLSRCLERQRQRRFCAEPRTDLLILGRVYIFGTSSAYCTRRNPGRIRFQSAFCAVVRICQFFRSWKLINERQEKKMTPRMLTSKEFDLKAESAGGPRADVSQELAATNPIGAT